MHVLRHHYTTFIRIQTGTLRPLTLFLSIQEMGHCRKPCHRPIHINAPPSMLFLQNNTSDCWR